MKPTNIIFSLIVVIIAAAAIVILSSISSEENEPEATLTLPKGEQRLPLEKIDVHLFFIDRNSRYLKSEKILLKDSEDDSELGRKIIEWLIKGPREELVRSIPENASLKTCFLDEDGLAYVDFTKEIRDDHPGGALTELLTIYSIVNSLILNIDAVDQVKILIDGKEADTLAGHIDLSEPFNANMLLIR